MTNDEILSNVALIRDAENPGENSAQRVGSTLEGIAQLAINNEKKIKTLENNENSTQDSIDLLNGYFTSNQGEDGKPSINRWNLPYYLNEAMVWGGDVNKLREITISDALRSKNSIRIEDTTTKQLTSTNYTSFKNVYFTVIEDLNFNGEYLTKGDIIISTGTKWVTLIGTHPRTEITIRNADANNVISFSFLRNEDEFVHYIFDENNTTYVFDAECTIGENNKMTFYVLVTNNSTKDITFNLPYNQVLVIPQGKERYFEARVINDRYVFAIPPLSDTESKISTLETEVNTQGLKINNFEISDFTGGSIKADFAYKVFNYLEGQINIHDSYRNSWKIEFILSNDADSLPPIRIGTECYIMPKNILMLDYSASEFVGLRPLDDVTMFNKNDIISIERFGTNISITLIRKF